MGSRCIEPGEFVLLSRRGEAVLGKSHALASGKPLTVERVIPKGVYGRGAVTVSLGGVSQTLWKTQVRLCPSKKLPSQIK